MRQLTWAHQSERWMDQSINDIITLYLQKTNSAEFEPTNPIWTIAAAMDFNFNVSYNRTKWYDIGWMNTIRLNCSRYKWYHPIGFLLSLHIANGIELPNNNWVEGEQSNYYVAFVGICYHLGSNECFNKCFKCVLCFFATRRITIT